ncbi:Uncharacterised protein [Mycobacterium tuberculosis]|nr:Uncharacterised protein [Mycobacterium tuberculosis]CKS37004.1 Uncharacterised protein [Mycobacterium tuberculosis]
MVKKCARPGIDHFNSRRCPRTSEIWVQMRVPRLSVRPLAGCPDMTSLESHQTRRRANTPTTAVMLMPSISLMSVCVVTEGHPNS